MKFRKMMGCIALGLTCAMIGAGATMAAQNTSGGGRSRHGGELGNDGCYQSVHRGGAAGA